MDTVPERIYKFLTTSAPPRICDDCIKAEMKLANRNQATQTTAALGATPLFRRYFEMCDYCGREKTVIEHA